MMKSILEYHSSMLPHVIGMYAPRLSNAWRHIYSS